MKQRKRKLIAKAILKALGNFFAWLFRSPEARQTAKLALEKIWKDIRQATADINLSKRK